MQQISTAEFKSGMGLKIKDKIFTIVEFQHVKPGKGGAFVRYKIKDLRLYYFMDTQTYEQIPVPASFIGDNAKWLNENDICQLMYADDDLLTVQPPMFIEVKITKTDPGFKGDTVQGGAKPATVETGAAIQVPMYLNEGDIVRVDTREGKFVARV